MKKGFVAFDNGGGCTLVCGNFAHSYDNGKQVAADVLAIICGADPSKDWDENDVELRKAMRTENMDLYDKVLSFEAIRDTLADPSNIEVEDDDVSIDGKHISGYTLSLFWRTISAS